MGDVLHSFRNDTATCNLGWQWWKISQGSKINLTEVLNHIEMILFMRLREKMFLFMRAESFFFLTWGDPNPTRPERASIRHSQKTETVKTSGHLRQNAQQPGDST
jgi:hypothetical protein